ncbi:MAG: (d)CMP kinase [Armatimonadetes bacterium]|jgi:cytidylate kinase|nr:(d)CMP kinase [Armatimonadota bacterium]
MHKPIIAIDGPAGAGKSTVAKGVADRLGYLYIDTGAMYRAIAWKVLQAGIAVSDAKSVVALAMRTRIRLSIVDGEQHVFADGEDVSRQIRSPEATRAASPVSAIPGVRKRLVELQREMAEEGGVVMEGRDIGTVVFPNAQVKIFLTASAEQRAERRVKQMREMGLEADIKQIAAEMRDRDLRDSSRADAPLTQAPDAILVDTDHMTVDQVIDAIVAVYNRAEAAEEA